MKNHLISIFLLLLVVVFGAGGVLPVFAATDTMADYWDKLHSRLGKTLVMLDEQQVLPDSSRVPLKKDKKSVEKDINRLLDETVDILNISGLSETKANINECLDDVQNYQARISELQTRKLMAPENEAAWKIWKNDVESYEKKIEAYHKKISEKEQAIAQLTENLRQQFAAVGIVLDPQEMDTLVYSVTGDDDIEIISVFNNIKTITAKLKDLTAESGEQIDNAKRYYGMHMLLLKILLNLQKNYVARVDDQYLPKLEKIFDDNAVLMDNTRTLLKKAPSHHRQLYQANLETQQLTERTINLYRRYLDSNRKRVIQSYNKIMEEYRVAENTYQTVSTAYTLISMMRSSDNLYNSISALQVPDLIKFDNREMKEEFKALSLKIER